VGLTITVPDRVRNAYGFDESWQIESFGAGHIHRTFRVTGPGQPFVLQRVNHYVFKRPDVIARNIRLAADYLRQHHPEYLFLPIIKTRDGAEMVYDAEGYPWRLLPYIDNTITINEVSEAGEAYEAAKGFGRLTRNLAGCHTEQFEPTIERFHDLGWRYEQFQAALNVATALRISQAKETIAKAKHFAFLVDQYRQLIISKKLKLRVFHNDTKINNILFDKDSRKAVCVIDLDTLMPGYFIYDLGDMVRSFVSPASEAESDLAKVTVRSDIYDALVDGYLSEMDDVLTPDEKSAIPFSGQMMTYIMALRFLADFLNGNVYYAIAYPNQNLDRARNQLRLLELLTDQLH
jgi:Ser/Thr protein kinase RdoA (MazF antagonist)